MDTTTFYATTSALCFTLLGFWWVVVQFRYAELTHNAGLRRFAFLVSLHFILPGVVSIASLISTGALWRVTFALAGVSGIVAVIVGVRDLGGQAGGLRDLARLAWLGVPLYGLVTLIALLPDVARTTLGLEPLQAEGFALTVILLLGILLAWLLFTAPELAAERAVEGDDPG